MFDIGFSELCVVGLVSLIVIGPEKLPKIARIAGFWLGKTQHTVAKIKAEIKEELDAEELRSAINAQIADEELSHISKDINLAAESLNRSAESMALTDNPVDKN
ncbi:MAG: twin-arginine translocase subunit TatB [Methylomicrobium sp.]|nr:twin-arginine translocase subunit TatB [Methylomicrobium sp.]